MNKESLLPPGFEDLEEFVDPWATESDWERIRLRTSLDKEEVKRVYDALLARLEEIILYLNQRSLSDLQGPEKRLYNLGRSAVEVAHLIERFGRPHPVGVYSPLRLEPLSDLSAPK